MNTHQVLIILVVDTRVLGCVTDSLQERRFASIGPTDYKDTKASIFRSEVIGNTVAHDRCSGGGKEGLRGNAAVEQIGNIACFWTSSSTARGRIWLGGAVSRSSVWNHLHVPKLVFTNVNLENFETWCQSSFLP